MRITNNIILHNTSININGNKGNVDTLNNQMTSQKKIHEMKWHENAPVFYSEKYIFTNNIVRNNRAGTECNIREYYAIRKSAFCNGGSKEWRRNQNRYLQKVRFVRG